MQDGGNTLLTLSSPGSDARRAAAGTALSPAWSALMGSYLWMSSSTYLYRSKLTADGMESSEWYIDLPHCAKEASLRLNPLSTAGRDSAREI